MLSGMRKLILVLSLVAILAGPAFVFVGPQAEPAAAARGESLAARQGGERVTVLVLGADTRPRYRTARPRTDSVMLLMVDPQQQAGGVLSLPRDLYVEIPGWGFSDRVNSAYRLGGGELAMKTVEQALGVPVDYYVLVEFEGFTTLIDEIGGLDVNVPRRIDDPLYPGVNGGYDPFTIEAGQQHMDGATALKYVRTRYSDSDFGRLQRQQDVLFALRDKVLRLNMLPTLISKAPALYAALDGSIDTNMGLGQMIAVAQAAHGIPRENIRSATVDRSHTTPFVTTQGADVLLPDDEKVAALVAEVFWLGEE